jgi:cell division protein FtsL
MQGLNGSEKILLIFLSTALFIFLVLAIVVLINFIKIQRSIMRTTSNIEEFTHKASQFSDLMKKTGPLFKLFSVSSDILNKRKK